MVRKYQANIKQNEARVAFSISNKIELSDKEQLNKKTYPSYIYMHLTIQFQYKFCLMLLEAELQREKEHLDSLTLQLGTDIKQIKTKK